MRGARSSGRVIGPRRAALCRSKEIHDQLDLGAEGFDLITHPMQLLVDDRNLRCRWDAQRAGSDSSAP